MSHFLDIALLPDPEFPAHQLMAALYAKLHRALAQGGHRAVGVCFPGYDERARTLGDRLRLVGPEGELARLMAQDWLRGMRDHGEVFGIAAVPAGARHRTLRRVQAKSSPERLRRRLMRRLELSAEEALARIPDSLAERLALPFVALASQSTGQQFRLFLRQGPLLPKPQAGEFNAYGLSSTATVPHF
ncbi:type I-F CRISPR-associated endoribonuclease Cas6/Csy4 [Azohydromonas caseinilytica]|uniref:Type I-F CRISPR-associated endoribonuclease Cas6/Csy4 n=1 Tax=Azohydromonas caseinilytica TaxID=2728836 RepID=A0A848FDG7_9BURK|nr:type I-F CRISPR-associated endoribonuclease Cas6/Csy4 [Azohydromonas caseinilytica]NML15971.1 type I-F CRISPR-associated endoribonuclease Cas6/Csy4 [Azohydromonas caseinilytica]